MSNQGVFGWPSAPLSGPFGFPGQDVARKEGPRLIQTSSVAQTNNLGGSVTFGADLTPGNVVIAGFGHQNASDMWLGGGNCLWYNMGNNGTTGARAWLYMGIVQDYPLASRSLAASSTVGGWMVLVAQEWKMPRGGVGGPSGSDLNTPISIGPFQFRTDEVAFFMGYSNSGVSQVGLPSGFTDGPSFGANHARFGYRVANGESFGVSVTAIDNCAGVLLGVS